MYLGKEDEVKGDSQSLFLKVIVRHKRHRLPFGSLTRLHGNCMES